VLEAEVAPETAGDPMSLAKWTRSSLRRLSQRLRARGHRASPPTVGRLLKTRKYTLKVNRKTKETGHGHPDRETQFGGVSPNPRKFRHAKSSLVTMACSLHCAGDLANCPYFSR